jgi:hypothetical protein
MGYRPLGTGESYIVQDSVLLPDSLDGEYWVIVKIDGQNVNAGVKVYRVAVEKCTTRA